MTTKTKSRAKKPVKNTAKAKAGPIKLKPGEVLVLRTCDETMQSYSGFVWPESGPVKCSDWDKTPECGNGLHGLLKGVGQGNLLNWADSAKWLVVAVVESECVDLGGKVKFPRGRVVHCGDRKSATDIMVSHYPDAACVGIVREGGDGSTITGGDCSTITGGYGSTITGGDCSTITGGDCSTITGGDGSTITGGYRSTITGGYRSTITGGYCSTITGGDGSTITGGYCSTITGGDGSTLAFRHWDGNRYRLIVEYVGENGIKPNVAYCIGADGKVVEKK